MKFRPAKNIYNILIILVITFGISVNPAASQQDPSSIYETDLSEEMEVLETGPVHEAFAETSVSDTKPGMVVPKAPPDPIEEVLPEREDLEEGAQWIPGYWAWDDDRNNFIWISGTYRVPPPGREWVPGQWIEVEHGYQWVSGYWADQTRVADSEYLPEPPESLEEGPNAEAPSPDHAWIPGCWVWTHGYYAWRPGYWTPVRPDWIWVPAYYVWTPHGYIYAGGYWDYPIARRGILYAPVYFYPRFFHRVVFHYRPSFVIGLTVFSDHLFIRPRYRHYYFGNYWAKKYQRRGIYSWRSRHVRRHGHDPIYTHQQWKKKKHRVRWKARKHSGYKKPRVHVKKRRSDIDRKRNNHKFRNGKDIGNYKKEVRNRKRIVKRKDRHDRDKVRDRKNRKRPKAVKNKNKNKFRNGKEIVNDKKKRRNYKRIVRNKDRYDRDKGRNQRKRKEKERRNFRNQRAPRPDPKTISPKKRVAPPRSKFRKSRAPRPSTKAVSKKRNPTPVRSTYKNQRARGPVQQPTRDRRVKNRNNRNPNQQYKHRQPHHAKEEQRYSRGNTVHRGRRPFIRNQNATPRGNHPRRSRRNTPRDWQTGQFGRWR